MDAHVIWKPMYTTVRTSHRWVLAQVIEHTRQLFIVEIKFRNDDPKIVIVMDDAASLFRYQVS